MPNREAHTYLVISESEDAFPPGTKIFVTIQTVFVTISILLPGQTGACFDGSSHNRPILPGFYNIFNPSPAHWDVNTAIILALHIWQDLYPCSVQ